MFNKNKSNGNAMYDAGVETDEDYGWGETETPTSKVSPAVVEDYLDGIEFPIDKYSLKQQAKKNHAPSDIMYVIDRFEEKEFNSLNEIAKEVIKKS